MTWSLQVRNGDLTLSSAHYGTVTGEQKLVQDFRAYLLEKMGTDDMHPNYGSLIDGGRLSNGKIVPGVIGETDPDMAELAITSEIRRIANQYQATQLERAKDDRMVYGKTALTKGEVLLGVEKIDYTRQEDSLLVNVFLQTGTSDEVLLELEFTL